MARKSKSRKAPEGARPRALRPADFVFPGEKGAYRMGVIGLAILFLWLAGLLYWVVKNPAGQRLWYVPLEVLAYPLLAVVIVNALAVRPRRAQFRKSGRQGKVSPNNYPELYRALTRQASLLGLKQPPEMYIVGDPQPLIFSLPAGRGTIVASQALRDALFPEEFEALMAHEVTHIACKHVRLDLAFTFIRYANVLLKLIFFPVYLMMLMARAWSEFIEFTADRGALLLTLRPAVVNAALVKFAVVADPNAGITREDLQAFLDSQGDISTDSQQMERHFRIGQFINSQPGLRERIEELTEFPRTKQGQEAIAKAAELLGVPVPSLSLPTRTEEAVETIQDEDEPPIPSAG